MNKHLLIGILFFIPVCCGYSQKTTGGYEELKKRIAEKRHYFSTLYASSDAGKQKDVMDNPQKLWG